MRSSRWYPIVRLHRQPQCSGRRQDVVRCGDGLIQCDVARISHQASVWEGESLRIHLRKRGTMASGPQYAALGNACIDVTGSGGLHGY